MSEMKISLPKDTKLPDHIVIIPDGNRRWARARGLTPMDGHYQGLKTMIKTLKAARQWGIHTATVWGLSTENWRERPAKEVNFLMKIIGQTIDKYINEAKRDGVRLVHLGRKDRLPAALIKKIKEAEEKTRQNSKYVLNIALDYGGQDEIVRAVRKIVEAGVAPAKIDTKLIDQYMDTADQPYPYPDLIIRTSGEQRTSGILLWQSHYAETYWEDGHFPDFTPKKLREAILDYSRRRRRFGGNDSVAHFDFKPEMTAKLELAWWRMRKIPKGGRFRDYVLKHLKEQYGLSKNLAKEAAKYLIEAVIEEDNGRNWEKAKLNMNKFYRLIKSELKLAFEPSLVASLEVKLIREMEGKEQLKKAIDAESTAQELYAEVYRISLLQAAKLAHLRILAKVERNLALAGYGEHHWAKAEDYLQKFYKALKERVA